MLANHSKFPPIADEKFLSGTCVLAPPSKIGISCIGREFRRETRRFLEEFKISVLSTVVARSNIGQGLSCFCPTIVIGGDDHAPLHLLGLLLDCFLERGWVSGSEIEACRAEYQSFVREQRELEWSSTRSHPNVGDVLWLCSLQAGFRARQHLFRVCIVTSEVKPFHVSSRDLFIFFESVPATSSHCSWASNFQ